MNLLGCSLACCFFSLNCDSEDIEQLVYETKVVLDAQLTCEAMA